MIEPVTMRMNYGQMSMAGHVALLRRLYCEMRNIAPKYGNNKCWDDDRNACISELAVANWLNLYWDGSVGDFKQRDCGRMVDVRAIKKRHRKLILHPADADDKPVVLALVDLPDVIMLGWSFARFGKLQQYWADPTGENRHAFFAPHSILRPMSELRDWVALQPSIWAVKRAA